MLKQKLMIATGNPGKLREINLILEAANLDVEIHSIAELDIPEPDEPYETFMENAKHKAKYYAQHSNMPTLSEDSGLCITALGDFPGVRSKEFVLECADIHDAFAKLEALLENHANKAAKFVCAAAIYFPDTAEFITYMAEDLGSISFPPRGTDCFGFDPIYVPDGYSNTMAELGRELKNKVGHRGKAMKGLLQLFKESQSYRV